MATASAPRINGFHSTDANRGAASEDIQELKYFHKAMSAISVQDGFRRFANLVKCVDSQEADLKIREGKINTLEAQLNACKASQVSSDKELFEKFEERHQQWMTKNDELRGVADALHAASNEKDGRIAILEAKLKECESKTFDLEKAYSTESKSAKNKSVQIAELRAQLNTAGNAIEDMRVRLKKADDNMVSQNNALQKETSEKQKLLSEVTKATKKIEKYKSFTVKIESLDIPEV